MESILLNLAPLSWWIENELVLTPLLFAITGIILAFRAIALRKKLTKQINEQKLIISQLRAELDLLLQAKLAPRVESEAIDGDVAIKESLPQVIEASTTPVADTLVEQSSTSLLSGLAKTRSNLLGKIRSLFKADSTFASEIEKLEEILISSDIGIKSTQLLIEKLKKQQAQGSTVKSSDVIATIKQEILSILSSVGSSEIVPEKLGGQAKIVLVVGVNGVGKTSTIGKLAWKFSKEQEKKVLLVACDTFRAAANEQLKIWSERSGATIVSGEEGEKPSTVAYRGAELACKDNFDVVMFDTAGRLHTKVNLMNELSNVLSVIEKKIGRTPDEIILVLDATTGQNALSQAREFHERLTLSGMVITKLDGTAKGGIIVPIISELAIPVRYIGIGEAVNDLTTFNAQQFVDALFEDSEQSVSELSNDVVTEKSGRVKRIRRVESSAEANSH